MTPPPTPLLTIADLPACRTTTERGASQKGGGKGEITASFREFDLELFGLILLLKLDKQLPVEQFEATASQSTVPSPRLTTDSNGLAPGAKQSARKAFETNPAGYTFALAKSAQQHGPSSSRAHVRRKIITALETNRIFPPSDIMIIIIVIIIISLLSLLVVVVVATLLVEPQNACGVVALRPRRRKPWR